MHTHTHTHTCTYTHPHSHANLHSHTHTHTHTHFLRSKPWGSWPFWPLLWMLSEKHWHMLTFQYPSDGYKWRNIWDLMSSQNIIAGTIMSAGSSICLKQLRAIKFNFAHLLVQNLETSFILKNSKLCFLLGDLIQLFWVFNI